MKSHIESDTLVPLGSYITPQAKTYHHTIFGADYSAPCKWYVRGIDNLGVPEELRALKTGEIKEKLTVETLMITGLRDKVCPADHARISMNNTVDGGEKGGRLRVVDVDAGHWIGLERTGETNRILGEFFEGDGRAKSLL
jgi:soluble epoxide hydrolase/lipid-phosphate phosphatase